MTQVPPDQLQSNLSKYLSLVLDNVPQFLKAPSIDWWAFAFLFLLAAVIMLWPVIKRWRATKITKPADTQINAPQLRLLPSTAYPSVMLVGVHNDGSSCEVRAKIHPPEGMQYSGPLGSMGPRIGTWQDRNTTAVVIPRGDHEELLIGIVDPQRSLVRVPHVIGDKYGEWEVRVPRGREFEFEMTFEITAIPDLPSRLAMRVGFLVNIGDTGVSLQSSPERLHDAKNTA